MQQSLCMLRSMLRVSQVAGEAVKDAPSWAGPDVIIATTMEKLDGIVAAAHAQASLPACCLPTILGLVIFQLSVCTAGAPGYWLCPMLILADCLYQTSRLKPLRHDSVN